ncbi:MAG: hypothetical protein Q4G62_04170 [Pseudomonadota bacterium]|nr:hypothetical protein [Pseudomonadota bacterium]
MRYHKTLKAREVLTLMDQSLSQAERRILIMCDGRRDDRHLVDMLGDDVLATLELLHKQGFLTTTPEFSNRQGGTLSSLGNELGKLWQRNRPGEQTVEATSAPAAPALSRVEPAAMVSAATRNTRRSMAACKMYMLDMLQLQRNMEASALAVDIQTNTGEEDLVARMFEALRWLQQTTKTGMFNRIAERLGETLPEPYLPGLHDMLAEIADGAVAANTNVVMLKKPNTASAA